MSGRQWFGMPRPFVIYLLLLAAVIPLSVAVWLLVGLGAAQTVSFVATTSVVLGTLAYAAIWHSRPRWPGVSGWRRLCRILTFTS